MRNLRIGTKLTVSFGAITLIVLGVALFAGICMSQMNAGTTLIVDDRVPKINKANEIGTAMADFRSAEAERALATDPEQLAATAELMRKNKDIVDRNYAALDPVVHFPIPRAALIKLKSTWDAYLRADQQMLTLLQSGQRDRAIAFFSGPMLQAYQTTSNAAGDFVTAELALARDTSTQAAHTFFMAKLLLALASAAALGGTIFFAVLLIRLIAKPLVGMTRAMSELAGGNMHVDVPVDPRTDEVGDLAKAMAIFRDQLRAAEDSKAAQTEMLVSSIGAGLDRLAQGDLTARIEAELTGPFAKLKADFNNALEEMAKTLATVSQSTGGVHTGASEISQASNDLSRRTEQQAASLEETAAAMDQITTTVRESAETAARANKIVAQARQEAEQSGEIVGRAIEAMSGIERASAEISEIISVIDGIAFQTNLLALNAGVEAARAGDAGKGFAVVASEVRALAQRSADAAKDVKARITASSEQVDAGVGLVSDTGAALQRIIASITEINGLVADIAASAEQQASGLQQVNTAVAEMDGVTQQNAAMVEEATAASRSLAAEADALASQIARFRLGATSGTRADPQPANIVHELQARVGRVQRVRRAAGGGKAAAAVVEDDWSQF
jgi:methyl-accepting chemotaxis protein